ncbi:MAG: hypothetical protein AMS22_03065 [Thiotrichales bacterium SG8_50]|nr:MAG: hypothetical protein AMS22_03065 [Thiotrichales bacterium SG8_50]
MISITVDDRPGTVILKPDGPLAAADFEAAAKQVDAIIEGQGDLRGILIHVEFFPGWDSFAGLVSHIRFVKNHHKHIKRVTIGTDSSLGTLAESLASHFVRAEISIFAFADFDKAKDWVARQ